MRASTIAEVAELSKVSLTTVSRVLNTPHLVSKERRARVEAAIRELNFVPLAAARNLKSGRSMTVGAIFPRLDSIMFGGILNQLQNRFDAAGYTVIAMTTGFNADMELRRVRQLISRGVDALILLGGSHSEETDTLINEHNVPYVNLWSWRDDAPTAQIGFSLRAAGRKAAEHLCSLGHKRIGVIFAGPDTNDLARDLLAGYRDALSERGVPVDEDLFRASDYSVKGGAHAFSSIISRRSPPTAILCTSDIFAAGALREANRMGLRVPQDISLTGFDDSELARITNPSLTSVRADQETIGDRCAEIIVGHLLDKEKLRSLKLRPELVVRESTAPPPA